MKSAAYPAPAAAFPAATYLPDELTATQVICEVSIILGVPQIAGVVHPINQAALLAALAADVPIAFVAVTVNV